MRNLLLIEPGRNPKLFGAFRTLTLPQVAAASSTDFNIKIMDGKIEKIKIKKDVDIVAMTFSCNTAYLAYDLAKRYKDIGIKTIAGGPHASLMPKEALNYFDSVVIGEAEGGCWESLLLDYKKGRLKKIYKNENPPSLDNLPFPRLDLLKKWKYIPGYPIETSRGCSHACSFCTARYIHGTKYRKMPINKIIENVERSDSNILIFMDNNIAGDKKFAKELFESLIPFKKKLIIESDILICEDKELIKLMAMAGCRGIFVGLESINSKSLLDANKRWNIIRNYKSYIGALQSHNIIVASGILFGFDNDDENIFQESLDFINKINLTWASSNLIIPYPGTKFYNKLKKENRILSDNYNDYSGYKVIIKPKSMTAEQLQEGFDWFNKEYYNIRNLIKIFFRSKLKIVNFIVNYLGMRDAKRLRKIKQRDY